MKLANSLLLLLAAGASLVAAWNHEIFRLKDEVEATEGPLNFYEFINAPSIYATQEELNKAYRKTSRQIHPDKFISPSKLKKSGKQPPLYPPKSTYIPQTRKAADERFARLGLVANILRGPERERYDHFLRNGFPRWRGTGYYYSRFRPGLTSVLLGLWIVFAGGAHYLIMWMNYSQQRKFMENYISDARTAAWGKSDLGAGLNLDILGDSGTPPPSSGPQGNRKQRRAAKAAGGSGTATPTGEPKHIAKRKVTSENGKVFLVTSLGDVFLVEEDEDGVTQEYLLDLEEIPKAEWGRTAMVTVPKGVYGWFAGKLGLGAVKGAVKDIPEITVVDGDSVEEIMEKKGLKKRTKGPGRK
ncbi:hypothetical protein AA313_de0202265 [Arthrobotrys entomopaga]|nr:hypothetical protein AA313_de0202265 [Arthrobotrys entomopaga]